MKLSSAVVVLSLTGTASAYSVSRSSIRNLGQKSVQATGPARSNGSTMKMEGTFFIRFNGCFGCYVVWEERALFRTPSILNQMSR